MSKSVTSLLPEPPAGSKWWVTVLDSNSGELGVKLARTKPYTEYGTAKVMDKWTPGKIRKHLQPLIDAAISTPTKLF